MAATASQMFPLLGPDTLFLSLDSGAGFVNEMFLLLSTQKGKVTFTGLRNQSKPFHARINNEEVNH